MYSSAGALLRIPAVLHERLTPFEGRREALREPLAAFFSVGWKKRFSVSPIFGISLLKRLSRASQRCLPLSRETLKAQLETVVKGAARDFCHIEGRIGSLLDFRPYNDE
jgi:hypothetical protein